MIQTLKFISPTNIISSFKHVKFRLNPILEHLMLKYFWTARSPQTLFHLRMRYYLHGSLWICRPSDCLVLLHYHNTVISRLLWLKRSCYTISSFTLSKMANTCKVNYWKQWLKKTKRLSWILPLMRHYLSHSQPFEVVTIH